MLVRSSLEEDVAYQIEIMDRSIEFLRKLKKTPEDIYQVPKEAESRVPSKTIILDYVERLQQTGKQADILCLLRRYNYLCGLTQNLYHSDTRITRKIPEIDIKLFM